MSALKDGLIKNGGIILVKKLSIEEIEEIEKKISELKKNSYYKYYFLLDDSSKPLEAYLINDDYYLDITSTRNYKLVGLIKLQTNKNNNLSELASLFIRFLFQFCVCLVFCIFLSVVLVHHFFNFCQFYRTRCYLLFSYTT